MNILGQALPIHHFRLFFQPPLVFCSGHHCGDQFSQGSSRWHMETICQPLLPPILELTSFHYGLGPCRHPSGSSQVHPRVLGCSGLLGCFLTSGGCQLMNKCFLPSHPALAIPRCPLYGLSRGPWDQATQ